MDLGYKGRRALIVGGSYGIGKASAAIMGAEGADVLIASRSAIDVCVYAPGLKTTPSAQLRATCKMSINAPS